MGEGWVRGMEKDAEDNSCNSASQTSHNDSARSQQCCKVITIHQGHV